MCLIQAKVAVDFTKHVSETNILVDSTKHMIKTRKKSPLNKNFGQNQVLL